jgi:hypothetical protein
MTAFEKPETVTASCGHQIPFMCVETNPRRIAEKIAKKARHPCGACKIAYRIEAELAEKGCQMLAIQKESGQPESLEGAVGDLIKVSRQKDRWLGTYTCRKDGRKPVVFRYSSPSPENVVQQLMQAVRTALELAHDVAYTSDSEATAQPLAE